MNLVVSQQLKGFTSTHPDYIERNWASTSVEELTTLSKENLERKVRIKADHPSGFFPRHQTTKSTEKCNFKIDELDKVQK